jgi:hypothetical protein
MDLKVFITSGESECSECGEKLGRYAWIMLAGEKGALCLPCADLDHLVFLPSGNAALTRRSAKYSTLTAVVLKWSRARKRYERQGLLVEEAALQRAEQECLADADARFQRQQRDAEHRADLDQEYIQQFAVRIHELYPACPAGREQIIAEHACRKYSGRVGRFAAAKSLDEKVIRLALIAHIRHFETNYDELLAQGWERRVARDEVNDKVESVLADWTG